MRARVSGVLAALMLVLLLPASASAAPKANEYHGTWTGGMFGGCTTSFWGSPMLKFQTDGEWSVSIYGDSAEVAATIWAATAGSWSTASAAVTLAPGRC